MIEEPHHIPLAHVEAETATVRRCLQKCGRQMQRQGEIPPEVSEAEINDEMEKHVPGIVRALHHSPLYYHFKKKHPRQLERHIRQLIEKTLLKPANSPVVAADQISYCNPMTRESLSPTWTHSNCGGVVYPSNKDTFACSSCKRTSELGVSFPESINGRNEQSSVPKYARNRFKPLYCTF